MKHKICTKIHLTSLDIFNILILATIAAPISMFYKHLLGNYRLISSLSEAIIIMLPALFISQRLRWSALVPSWLIAIFYLTNIWHWRFFSDMMPLESYFFWKNIDGNVIGTWLSLIKPIDLALVAPVITATFTYFFYFRQRIPLVEKYTKRMRINATACIIAYYLVFSHLYPTYCDIKNSDDSQKKTYLTELSLRWNIESVSKVWDYLRLNLTGYIARESYLSLYRQFRSRNVSEQQIAMVTSYMHDHNKFANDECDSIHAHISAPRKI
jgi:hypothetical protein